MLNWLRKKLGVLGLCPTHKNLAGGEQCPACVGYTRGYADATRIERSANDLVITDRFRVKGPQRYDEIERDRSRRQKAG